MMSIKTLPKIRLLNCALPSLYPMMTLSISNHHIRLLAVQDSYHFYVPPLVHSLRSTTTISLKLLKDSNLQDRLRLHLMTIPADLFNLPQPRNRRDGDPFLNQFVLPPLLLFRLLSFSRL